MIWCLGMYASGSTWVFNAAMKVAARVVPAKPVVGHYVAARDQQLDFLDDPAPPPVVKSHDTDEAAAIKLAQARRRRVAIDPRSADRITSLMLHQRASFPAALDWSSTPPATALALLPIRRPVFSVMREILR